MGHRDGVGILLKGPDGFKVCYTIQFDFPASNNMVEYEVLLNSIQITMEVGVTDLRMNNDSQLVVNHIKGVYQVKDQILQKYLDKVRALERELSEQGIVVWYEQISQYENEEADLHSELLAKKLEQFSDEVYVQQKCTLTFEKPASIMKIDEEQSWMSPYIEYLEARKLLEDKIKAQRIAAKAANHQVVRGTLYRRGKSCQWLRCVRPEEGIRIIKEIYQEIFGVNEGATMLANKIFQQDYYWPIVKKKAGNFVKRCYIC